MHQLHRDREIYLVYYKKYDDKMCKFVSLATKQNVDVLKRYIESQKGIDLYIDSKNPINYFFDLPYV